MTPPLLTQCVGFGCEEVTNIGIKINFNYIKKEGAG